MSSELWNIIIPALSGFVTGIGGYVAGRKQREKDADSQTLTNLDKAFLLYKNIIDDMKSRYDAEIKELRREITILETELTELKNRLSKHEAL